MLGATGVVKPSLIRQFVHSIYSEKYHATIGVKIDKKQIETAGQPVTLMLWDLQGEDNEHQVRPSFLRGAAGYFLVVDQTRHETLVTAFSIQQMVEREVGKVPFIVLLNKNDLSESHEVSQDDLAALSPHAWQILRTSAKSGENVNPAFNLLARKMLANQEK
jgi:small GTP-binding protein